MDMDSENYYSSRVFSREQIQIINSLVDRIGFKNSPFREAYLNRTLEVCKTVADTNELIKSLQIELSQRNSPIPKTYHTDHFSVTDLSTFKFCSASYAIKETFEIVSTPLMIKGDANHTERYLEKYLENIKINRRDKYNRLKKNIPDTVPLTALDMDMLESNIIFAGHRYDKKEPFYSDKKNLVGIPDYIFHRPNGTKFVVEEKHTWTNADITEPYPNHVIQLLGYIHGLQTLELTDGYIIYFLWGGLHRRKRRMNNSSSGLKNNAFFHVSRTESGKSDLIEIFNSVQSIKNGNKLEFDSNQIQFNKCFKCRMITYCIHKTGICNMVMIPYYENFDVQKFL
jgi:hypothetical protein